MHPLIGLQNTCVKSTKRTSKHCCRNEREKFAKHYFRPYEKVLLLQHNFYNFETQSIIQSTWAIHLKYFNISLAIGVLLSIFFILKERNHWWYFEGNLIFELYKQIWIVLTDLTSIHLGVAINIDKNIRISKPYIERNIFPTHNFISRNDVLCSKEHIMTSQMGLTRIEFQSSKIRSRGV